MGLLGYFWFNKFTTPLISRQIFGFKPLKKEVLSFEFNVQVHAGFDLVIPNLGVEIPGFTPGSLFFSTTCNWETPERVRR